MWTAQQEATHRRDRQRFQNNLTDVEWAHLARLIPPAAGWTAAPDRHAGGDEAIFSLLRTGCPWRYRPSDGFPLRSTV